MKKKKILFINDLISGGGVENVLFNIVSNMSEKKYDITIMTWKGNKEIFHESFAKHVKYKYCGFLKNPYKKYSLRWTVKKVVEILYKVVLNLNRYDIIIAMKEGMSMKLASQVRAKRRFAWVHVDYRYLYWTKYIFERPEKEVLCMKRFERVNCVSSAVADSICEVVGNPGNLCVIYNPIPYQKILKQSQISTIYRKPEGKPLFVAAGRIVEVKNYKLLLKACSVLGKDYEFELWIIGDGEQKKELESMISDLNLTCVRLLGNQKNPYPIIKMADWFLSPSLCESYGLAIQEALILGIPVLVMACPAIEEIFDERFGIMVSGDEEAYIQELRKILEHHELASHYRENIKQSYPMKELWDERLQKIYNLWEN